MSTQHTPVWSSVTSASGRKGAQDLLAAGWALSTTRDGLEREFVFRGFARAWTFMNMVADECKVQKHHPEWANVYNTVQVRWTTHNPRGLGDKDVQMAQFCDAKAAEVGEVPSPSPPPSSGGPLKAAGGGGKVEGGNVLDRMMPAGTECAPCTGKKE